jgi:shikimate dehydrogenase
MVYCTFPVTDLSKFMRHFAPFLDGFSVTIPYKESIIKFLDELDEAAEAIGAVNTVIRRKGKLYGLNTDAPAALDAIECVGKVKGKRLLLIGAGGSARAIAYEAKRRGAEVLIANRTDQRAKTLAKELGLEHVHMAYIRLTPFDILVNATPVGMVPHVTQSPAPKEILRDKVVFDAVYNPPMTRLLRLAKSVGATIVPGTEMYLNQAALQSELFTGRRPNIDMMREILLSHLSEKRKKA